MSPGRLGSALAQGYDDGMPGSDAPLIAVNGLLDTAREPAVRAAAVWYRPRPGRTLRPPDYHVHRTADWLVLPYEIRGIDRDEMARQKPWLLPILDDLKPDWR